MMKDFTVKFDLIGEEEYLRTSFGSEKQHNTQSLIQQRESYRKSSLLQSMHFGG